VADLADDKNISAGSASKAGGSVPARRKHYWRNAVLIIWLLLTGAWLASCLIPWQFSMQSPTHRMHLYVIDGTLYWQHENIRSLQKSSFIQVGTLANPRLLAPATRMLITTNGLGGGGRIVGLHGLVWTWNPLAGSGLWMSPLVLALIFIGPLAWWLARRWGRRTSAAPKIRTA
jgi:hypothetical protein